MKRSHWITWKMNDNGFVVSMSWFLLTKTRLCSFSGNINQSLVNWRKISLYWFQANPQPIISFQIQISKQKVLARKLLSKGEKYPNFYPNLWNSMPTAKDLEFEKNPRNSPDLSPAVFPLLTANGRWVLNSFRRRFTSTGCTTCRMVVGKRKWPGISCPKSMWLVGVILLRCN